MTRDRCRDGKRTEREREGGEPARSFSFSFLELLGAFVYFLFPRNCLYREKRRDECARSIEDNIRPTRETRFYFARRVVNLFLIIDKS